MGADADTMTGAASRQFVSFDLDDETFALDVARVREILDWTGVTRVPRMPAFMRGVLNVRGAVIPVVDLRVKFGMSPAEPTVDTCVVVAEVEVDGEPTVVGALVDKVREVFEVSVSALEPPPKMGAKLEAEFIQALVHYEDDVLIALDIDHVLSVDEIIAVRRAGAGDESGGPRTKAKRSRTPGTKGEDDGAA